MAGPGAVGVAIVHERFTEWGGSEEVVAGLHALWPAAAIHTPIADRRLLAGRLPSAHVRTSGLQAAYRGGRRYAHLLPLLPLAMARLRLDRPSVVIASHHAFSNRVRLPDGARLVSYVHTPARWMWDPAMRASEAGGAPGRAALATFAASQRHADIEAARTATVLLANSTAVSERIRAWWGLASRVVAPPVDTRFYCDDPGARRDDFFLLAGRLVPYKRPDVAVEAARRAGVRLVVAGEGRMHRALEGMAGAGVTLLGRVTRQELRRLYRTCRALVFPGEEDFGIVPVEAQACGAPVIALGRGGALDSVEGGLTGVLYPPGADEVDALAAELRRFDPDLFDPAASRRQAGRFSAEAFGRAMRAVVDGVAQGPW